MASPFDDTAPAGAGARRWRLRRPPRRRGPGPLSHEPATSRAPDVITGAQIRAARKLLGWEPFQLAQRAKLHSAIVQRAESGAPPITKYQEALIRSALEAAGVEFTSGDEPGVKLN